MLRVPTSVVIPVELSEETKIPNGPFPAEWLRLGRHYQPIITMSHINSDCKTIDLGQPCNGPLILQFTGGNKRGLQPNLLCALPRAVHNLSASHDAHFTDFWESKFSTEDWPPDELTARITRWLIAAQRGPDGDEVVAPFVLSHDYKQAYACFETGLIVSAQGHRDLPVLLALVPDELLLPKAFEAAMVLLMDTWSLTDKVSKEIIRRRGFRT